MVAAKNGHSEVAALLIERGANIHAQSKVMKRSYIYTYNTKLEPYYSRVDINVYVYIFALRTSILSSVSLCF